MTRTAWNKGRVGRLAPRPVARLAVLTVVRRDGHVTPSACASVAALWRVAGMSPAPPGASSNPNRSRMREEEEGFHVNSPQATTPADGYFLFVSGRLATPESMPGVGSTWA